MKKFSKRPNEDGKTCLMVEDHTGFRGFIRFFKTDKDWGFLEYPSGRIHRFATMAEAKEEALKA